MDSREAFPHVIAADGRNSPDPSSADSTAHISAGWHDHRPPTTGEPKTQDLRHSQIKLLLFEESGDQASPLLHTLRRLSEAGTTKFTVTHATQLSEALGHLEQSEFDVVLLDLPLEESRDLGTLSAFYASSPQAPIIVVSDKDDEELAVQAAHLGAEDYLVKDWTRDDLLVRHIKCAIERKRLQEERARVHRQGEAERAFLHEVLRQMMKGVIIAEAPSGRLLLGNDKVAEIWKHPFIPSPSIEEYTQYKGFHLDGRPYSAREWPLARSILFGEVVADEEIAFLRGDGRRGIMSVSSAPVRDRQGRIVAGVVTFYDATERKKIESELRESRERLHTLSHKLIIAQEEERRHIARELHDQIGQSLTALKIDLQSAQRAPDVPMIVNRLEQSIETLELALRQVRDLSFDLRPSLLDDLGLFSALRWYTDRWAQQTGIQMRFVAEGFDESGYDGSGRSGREIGEERWPEGLDIVCFRIVQEALTNVVRHAHAQAAEVRLRLAGMTLELEVRDNGLGFDVKQTLRQNNEAGRLGLLGMQERVELMGGGLTIRSNPTEGTQILARFPMSGTPTSNDTASTPTEEIE